jgi:hypothetical protein
MTGKPKPFKQYAFAPLIDGNGKSLGYGVRVGDERAYAQALGYAVDHLHQYSVATAEIVRHLRETVCPDIKPEVLEHRVARWRDLPHWREHYPRRK